LEGSGLSGVVFAGHTVNEVRKTRLGAEVLARIDALIDGGYVSSFPFGRGLLGSENQRIHLLSERYELSGFRELPTSELVRKHDGSVTVSSVHPLIQRNKNT
jgi:anaerobic ribonucleoside-triphosphate reductase activating protein